MTAWEHREDNVCDECGNDTPEPKTIKGKVLCPRCAEQRKPKSRKKASP